MVRLDYLAAFAVTLAGSATAIDLDITSEESIKNAAATAAFNTMSYYTGNQTGQIPGNINSSWWEGGALFDTMIQYWYFTGDASNNPAVSQGMYFQRGNDNYMPSNWSSYMGNDDQMAWALAAMTAAELDFPQGTDMPSWLTLAERVFNMQAARWDTNTCGGGLRWQIWPYEAGYTMKNAVSNGGLFQLAARLARYTNNQTYSDWAETIWNWSVTHLINEDKWTVADSTQTDSNCSTVGNNQWTYNYGMYLGGAAYMYNYTNGETAKWKTGLDGLLNTTFTTFFPEKYGGEIMSEVLCEPLQVCNDAEITFKGLLAGDLTFVSIMAPYTASDILPRLQGSAAGAAKQCSGGDSGTVCGVRWYQSTWDGWSGMEEDMSATSIFTSNLVAYKDQAPATQTTATNETVSANGTVTGSGTTTTSTTSESSGVVKSGASALAYGPFGVIAAVVAVAIA
ncbi:mannan endo-1,6-alpha-mannosidase [Aspergillus sclerotiicarbonarius CBS 121057]|uniref:Mannan endo-1,6-alpha-mannosidase n=1 Tax=Aspergillus sclerotiicarbonarius (strain CBS 121057 / IBT 28362) TaxID=1448318 RepID=A0A319EDQ4_ASPSB|nr:mannan endo-1,6-alpha-mannosidase [Aspergillus sclerotiicarbonarius CBS 121057]